MNLMDQVAAAGNIFVDPAGAVKRMRGKWPWLVPFAILCIGTVIMGLMVGPIALRVMQVNPPGNIPPEQLEKSIGMMATFQKVGIALTPLLLFVKLAVLAGLITGLSSMLDVKAGFQRMFTLLSYCSLIPFLQSIAGTIVILAKRSQIQSMQELQPPFGLDLFITEGSKPLLATLNYFSIFTIWYLVILVFAYSFMTGSARGKAMVAITPAWLLPLLFAIVGSFFNR
jgi:Yip1-like protein